MTLRFTFTAPDNTTFVASEPYGWSESTLNLIRHSDFHSLIKNFDSSFQTYGNNGTFDGGRDWLLAAKKNFGVDALIGVLVEIDPDDESQFETLFEGNLAIGLFIETLNTDHFLQIVFNQKTFWSKFIARYDSKVDPQSRADLDGNTVVPINFKPIPLPSQKIIKSYQGYRKYNSVITTDAGTAYPVYLFGFDVENLKEIEQQSALAPSVISSGNGQTIQCDVPAFTVIDDGEFVIDNIFLTLSAGNFAYDSGSGGGVDFEGAKNYKCDYFNTGGSVTFDLFLQKNTDPPIKFSHANRAVPTSYVRNDGVTENLHIGAHMPYVVDYSFQKGYVLNLKKYDSVKIFGIVSPDIGPPYNRNIIKIFMWGTDGWSHDSGFDQMRYGQKCYYKLTSGVFSESNQGDFAYGGIFLPTGSFPTTIDNDAGTGLAIKASQWWTINTPGRVVGGTVLLNEGDVIQAKVNSPTDSLADWNVTTKTPYEGLEAYGSKATSFQGYYDPSLTSNFPITRGDGATGATPILAFDRWYIQTFLASLGGAYVDSTYIIQALFDSPGTTRANWWIGTRKDYEDYYLADRQFQGNWDASVNIYPSFEADGASAIKADDIWIISVPGIAGGIGGVPLPLNGVIRARVNTPGQTNANWDVFLFADWQVYAKANIKYFSGMQITFNTTYQDTIGQGFLVHDLAAGILDRICGQPNLIYSPFMGNPYTSKYFASTGCASLLAVFKGLQVRGYDLIEKPHFASFKEFWEGLNPIFPLGLGYSKDNSGNDIIIIDDRAGFYVPTIIVKLDNVYDIKRSYENDEQYNAVEIGYNKWQSQAATGIGTPSGIDDPQTKQTRNTIFKNIGQKISILSGWIAASLTFETARRVTNKQSANYTYDNDTFIVALKSLGSGKFTPELNENFSEIDNLTNSDTRYNTRLSTTRNFLRHVKYVSGCLQDYLSSFFRFASGEGNYRMASKITTACPGDDTNVLVTENMDVQVSNDPVHLAEAYEIKHYLTWDQFKTIEANPNNAIGISQTDADHKTFFIKSLKYNLASGDLTLIAWPHTLADAFDLEVIESPTGSTSARRHESRFDPRYD